MNGEDAGDEDDHWRYDEQLVDEGEEIQMVDTE